MSKNTLIFQIETEIDLILESIEKDFSIEKKLWKNEDRNFLQYWDNYNVLRNKLLKLDNGIFKELKEMKMPKTKDINFVTKGLYFPNDLDPLFKEFKKAKKYLELLKTPSQKTISDNFNFIKYSWKDIEIEYEISKNSFGRKINFVRDCNIREIIFRDVENAFSLSKNGYSKSAVLLAGSVVEELLRQYIKHRNIISKAKTFNEFIKVFNENNFLKLPMSAMPDSIRQFRNLVHIKEENEKNITLSKDIAIGSVSIIFTIVNGFN